MELLNEVGAPLQGLSFFHGSVPGALPRAGMDRPFGAFDL